jgi:hypothetical protein
MWRLLFIWMLSLLGRRVLRVRQFLDLSDPSVHLDPRMVMEQVRQVAATFCPICLGNCCGVLGGLEREDRGPVVAYRGLLVQNASICLDLPPTRTRWFLPDALLVAFGRLVHRDH